MISRNTISVLVLGNCVSCECFGGGDIFSGIQAFAQDIGIRDVQFSVDLDPGKRVEHVLDSLHAYCNGEMPVPPEVAREALAPSLAVKTYDLVVLDAWTHAMRSAAFLQGGWLDTRGGVEGMRIPHLTLYAPHIHEVFLVAAGPSEPSLFRDCCSALAERSGNGFGSRVLILNATSHVPRKTKPHPPYRNCNLRYCQTAGVCTESELETYLRGYNQALEGLSSSRLAVLDLDRLFLEKGISKKNCVVHLSREGYGLLAREVLSLLSETFFPELGPQPESVSCSAMPIDRPDIRDISRDLISLSASDEIFGVSGKLERCFQGALARLRGADHSRIALFGASASGKVFLLMARSQRFPEVAAFLDNNPAKWGKTFAGVPIRAARAIGDLDVDAVVIASSGGEGEIARQMAELTRGDLPVYSLFRDFAP